MDRDIDQAGASQGPTSRMPRSDAGGCAGDGRSDMHDPERRDLLDTAR
jgi:hypothetical protein